jgi:hypothetical protein
MKLLQWFDSWVLKGPFTPRDLGIYRILLCLLLIPYAPKLRTLATYPDSFYDPPFGPFRLLQGFPSDFVLSVIEVLAIGLIITTLLGLYTRTSSIALSVVMILGYGFIYSVGKIDHLMVLMIVPAVMSFANWGDSFSIDALKRARPGFLRGQASVPTAESIGRKSQPQWPLRFLAVAIGIAFCTAAGPKVTNGWLSISSQATYGYQVNQDSVKGTPGVLSAMLVDFHVPVLWETLDWITVILEWGIILCVFSWRSWRIGLAILSIFHLAIALSLGIYFIGNVLAYGAFVAWGARLPSWRLSARMSNGLVKAAPVLAIVVTIGLWLIGDSILSIRWLASMFIVFTGAGIGVFYLGSQAVALMKLVGRQRRPVSVSDGQR